MAALVVLPLAAGACAAPTGDFGRTRPSYFNDTLLPSLGEGTALVRREPVSDAPLTDHERELRDLAYVVLMPAGDRQLWDRALTEMVRTRVLAPEYAPFNPAGYSEELLSTAYRSSTARYARLIDDTRADIGRVGPFFGTASRVGEMDAVREKALAQMIHLSPQDRESAMARVFENRMLIAWVQRRFLERLNGYRLALDRLVAATPAPAAVEAERTLKVLASRLAEIPQAARVAALDPQPPGVVVSK